MDWDDPEEVISAALRVLPDYLQHKFGLWCVEQVRHLLKATEFIKLLDAKSEWVGGQVSDLEFDLSLERLQRIARDRIEGQFKEGRSSWAAGWAVILNASTNVESIKGSCRDAAWASTWEKDSSATANRGGGPRKAQAAWLIKNHKQQIHEGLVAEAFGIL